MKKHHNHGGGSSGRKAHQAHEKAMRKQAKEQRAVGQGPARLAVAGGRIKPGQRLAGGVVAQPPGPKVPHSNGFARW